MTGICKSSITTSGRSSLTRSTAILPFSASPHTSQLPFCSMQERRPLGDGSLQNQTASRCKEPPMAKKHIRPPTRSSARASSSDGDGNHIHNEILLGLPRSEQEKLLPKLEFVRLKTHHVLHEPGDTLKSAYFCNTGLISILSVFPDGKSVEVGLIPRRALWACRWLRAFALPLLAPSPRLRAQPSAWMAKH